MMRMTAEEFAGRAIKVVEHCAQAEELVIIETGDKKCVLIDEADWLAIVHALQRLMPEK